MNPVKSRYFMPDQPENVIPFDLPTKTTLPYPVQVVCDRLPIRQDADQGELLQFTINDPALPVCPTFYIKKAELSVSELAIKFAETKCAFIERMYRRA